MEQKLKKYCDVVNSLLEKGNVKGIVDTLIDMEHIIPDSSMYWNRTVFIRCGCDSDKCWKIMKEFPNEFMCVISDDLVEHPGLTIKFKNIEEDY